MTSEIMDKITPEQRHSNMAAIRGKDTKPEMLVRKYLWAHGFRYRLNHGRLPGRPDIVMRKYRTCIFINGCFWHGHNAAIGDEIVSSDCCKIPKSNTDFWVKKISKNKERDKEVQYSLAKMGWHCISIWECELKPSVREATLKSLAYTLDSIFLDNQGVKRYEFDLESAGRVAADDGERD